MDHRQSDENSTDGSEEDCNPLSEKNKPEAKVKKASPLKAIIGFFKKTARQNTESVPKISNPYLPNQDQQSPSGSGGNVPSTSSGRLYRKSKNVEAGTFSHKGDCKKISHPSGGNYSEYRSPVKSETHRSPPTQAGATEDRIPPIPRLNFTPPQFVHPRNTDCMQSLKSPEILGTNVAPALPPRLYRSPASSQLNKPSRSSPPVSPIRPRTHGHPRSPVQRRLNMESTLPHSTELQTPPRPRRAPITRSPDEFLPREQNIVASGSELPYIGISPTRRQTQIAEVPSGSVPSGSEPPYFGRSPTRRQTPIAQVPSYSVSHGSELPSSGISSARPRTPTAQVPYCSVPHGSELPSSGISPTRPRTPTAQVTSCSVPHGSELPSSGISRHRCQSPVDRVKRKIRRRRLKSGTPIRQNKGDGSVRKSNRREISSSGSSLTSRPKIESNVQYGNACTHEIASHSSRASSSSGMVGASNFPLIQSEKSSISLQSSHSLSSGNHPSTGHRPLNRARGLNKCCSTVHSCYGEGSCRKKCNSCSNADCVSHCGYHCIEHCSLHDCASLMDTLCMYGSSSPSTFV